MFNHVGVHPGFEIEEGDAEMLGEPGIWEDHVKLEPESRDDRIREVVQHQQKRTGGCRELAGVGDGTRNAAECHALDVGFEDLALDAVLEGISLGGLGCRLRTCPPRCGCAGGSIVPCDKHVGQIDFGRIADRAANNYTA